MGKYFKAIICFFIFASPAWAVNPAMMQLIQGLSDGCQSGVGTYSLAWGGEYPGDTDKACLDTGDSTADATDASAGVIVGGGAITGNYGALINAVGEHVRWAAESSTIDNAGTVQIAATLPAALTNDRPLFEIYLDSENSIMAYYHQSTDRLYLRHESAADTYFHYVAAPAESATVSLGFTWKDTATETFCIEINSGGWDCDDTTNNFSNFSAGSYAIGEDQDAYIGTNLTTGTDAWKIDDVYFFEGYQR